ncbi:hypothetical protein FFLO_05452 [Filobasidium floriforme]|uniref:Uncharacterized protein n=1 Tax=Filobasidium floriforme TaxID=5210 RepID=A0A8K0JII2_9TREE|nr:hypothetical protein FFLO_05452 [Filobasidium floriforme]
MEQIDVSGASAVGMMWQVSPIRERQKRSDRVDPRIDDLRFAFATPSPTNRPIHCSLAHFHPALLVERFAHEYATSNVGFDGSDYMTIALSWYHRSHVHGPHSTYVCYGSADETDHADPNLCAMPFASTYQGQEGHGINHTVPTGPFNRDSVFPQQPLVSRQADISTRGLTSFTRMADHAGLLTQPGDINQTPSLFVQEPAHSPCRSVMDANCTWNHSVWPSTVTVPSAFGPLDQAPTCFQEEFPDSARYTLQSSNPTEDEPSQNYPGHSSASMSARGNGGSNANTSAVIYGGITKIHVRRPKKAATRRGPPDISSNDFVASKIDNAMEYSVSASQSRSTRSFDKVVEKRLVWADPNYQGDLTEQLRNNIQKISRALRIIAEAWEVQLATGTQGIYKITCIREKDGRTSVL